MTKPRQLSSEDMAAFKKMSYEFCVSRMLSNDAILKLHGEVLTWYMAGIHLPEELIEPFFAELKDIFHVYESILKQDTDE